MGWGLKSKTFNFIDSNNLFCDVKQWIFHSLPGRLPEERLCKTHTKSSHFGQFGNNRLCTVFYASEMLHTFLNT